MVAAAGPRQLASIPAAAQGHADRVVAGAQQVSNIVGLVLEAFLVAGPSRRQHVISDAPSVDHRLVETVTRDVCARLQHSWLHLERPSHHGCGRGLRRVLLHRGLDPAGLPVTRVQQSHFPECGSRSTATFARCRPRPVPASNIVRRRSEPARHMAAAPSRPMPHAPRSTAGDGPSGHARRRPPGSHTPTGPPPAGSPAVATRAAG